MHNVKILSSERIAEIKAFKNTNFSDCPVLTDEELKKSCPRHPEYFKPKKQAVQIRLDADALAWFKGCGTPGSNAAERAGVSLEKKKA